MTVLFVWFGSLFLAPLVLAIFFEIREWMDNRDRARMIERARDLEDAEVAWLDSLWALPTRVPGTDRRI